MWNVHCVAALALRDLQRALHVNRHDFYEVCKSGLVKVPLVVPAPELDAYSHLFVVLVFGFNLFPKGSCARACCQLSLFSLFSLFWFAGALHRQLPYELLKPFLSLPYDPVSVEHRCYEEHESEYDEEVKLSLELQRCNHRVENVRKEGDAAERQSKRAP